MSDDELKANALITLIVAVIIGGIIWAIVAMEHHHENVVMPEGFRAWVKQTGNPKELTYDEWRALMRATDKQPDVVVIPMPMPQ